MMRIVRNWRVREDILSYSDHNYIEFYMGDINRSKETYHRRKTSMDKYPRWVLKDLDVELMEEVIDWHSTKYLDKTDRTQISIDKAARSVKQMMTEASDTVTRRARMPLKKKQVYWWNSEIMEARATCIQKRRWTREKRKKIKDIEKIKDFEQRYRP